MKAGRFIVPLMAALLCIMGCGLSDDSTARIHGTISFRGQPVPNGRIYFDIDQKLNPGGQQGFADIRNGRYDTADGGKAPSVGAATIRVEGLTAPDANGNVALLFRQYELKFEIPPGTTLKDLEVPSVQGENMPKNAEIP